MIKVIDGVNAHDVSGRLETIIRCLLENAGEVVKPQNAQIIFDCAGYKVSATIKKQMEVSSRPDE